MTIDLTSQVTPTLPGQLGDPGMTIGADPRVDPRIGALLASFGMDGAPEPPPVNMSSPYEAQLEFANAAEGGFQALFGALFDSLPEVEGVIDSTETIKGVDGNEITLYVSRPAKSNGALPGLLHIHGGGMAILTAADSNYRNWRQELAATGMVVVGVEFRNAAGVMGPHPFPAGLNDCKSALQWMHDSREQLGLSKIVVSGESGGGNLTLATALYAKQEGRLDQIQGVYALCPYISNAYGVKRSDLASTFENDGYFLHCEMMGALAAIYEPEGNNPGLAWPLHADDSDLEGLPPHVISVNELDPLRDEGLAYYRRLSAAGTPVVSRQVSGTVHSSDMWLPVVPDIAAETIRSITGFVQSV